MLAAGSSLKAVLVDFEVFQSRVARRASSLDSQVHGVLAGGAKARRQGAETRMAVYQAAAALLGVRVEEIPEAADLLIRSK